MRLSTHEADCRRARRWRVALRGGAVLLVVAGVGTLGGWTAGLGASDVTRLPELGSLARRMGKLSMELEAARGEVALTRLELERAKMILENSARYQIPADLAAAIYDNALGEGLDPGLAFQLVKVESSFRRDARSSMDAIGYTQIQLATARLFEPELTERDLFRRDVNLRLGFRFLKDLLERFDGDVRLALLAYNRGPARVSTILAQGGDPSNGYSELVLSGYQPGGATGAGAP